MAGKVKQRGDKTKAQIAGYRSGLEDDIADQIRDHGIDVVYEDKDQKISYTKPETKHKYNPDFRLPNGIIIETKGRFMTADRLKHVLIKKQFPDLDIRFVFNYSRSKISKSSKTTYADWCIKHGFLFADKLIPEEWFNEPPKQLVA